MLKEICFLIADSKFGLVNVCYCIDINTWNSLSFDSNLNSFVPILAFYAVTFIRLLPSFNRVLTSIQNIRYGLPVLGAINELFVKYPIKIVLCK